MMIFKVSGITFSRIGRGNWTKKDLNLTSLSLVGNSDSMSAVSISSKIVQVVAQILQNWSMDNVLNLVTLLIRGMINHVNKTSDDLKLSLTQ